MYIKTKYMFPKIFDNTFVSIRKSKFLLNFNKPTYTRICIVELINKFSHDYVKNKYNKTKLLFTDTDSLMHETKTEDIYEGFSCLVLNAWF